MADTTTGGPGVGGTCTVRYRRMDGTKAAGQMQPDGHGGLVWHAPEECAAILEVEYPPAGGGAASHHLAIPADCAEWPTLRIDAPGWESVLSGQLGAIQDIARAMAERDAQIARLTAELDDARSATVELVPAGYLETAMAADPDRLDGTVLRETGGQRRAFAWRAATKEWEQVT